MKFVAVGLLVLLALGGLPLASGGGAMMVCPSCPSGHATTAFAICLAIAASAITFFLAISVRVTLIGFARSPLAVGTKLLRPPREL